MREHPFMTSIAAKAKKIIIPALIITIFTIAALKPADAALLEDDNRPVPLTWSDGWFFIFGGGYTASTYLTNLNKMTSAEGGHIFTEIGYNMDNYFAIHIGSIVNIVAFDDITITHYKQEDSVLIKEEMSDLDIMSWDTLFYYGITVRIPGLNNSPLFNPYFKIFNGFAATVSWVSEIGEEDASSSFREASRFFQSGPLFGIAFGNAFYTGKNYPVWFLQLTFSVKLYMINYSVKDGDVLPEIIGKEKTQNNEHMLQLQISVGTRLF